ncbi:hypothetical protein Scep_019059 [Stephania cephalantha]|uniref:Zinc knuckle CX2CX4HX4C domain-containing protein n=1 Tax=Stephania cephalantha TaxID=152367 RepID=A0AAP0IAE5_9MAGN
MNYVLEQGLWLFDDFIFITLQWDSYIHHQSVNLKFTKICMQLHGVTLDCRADDVAKKISEHLRSIIQVAEEYEFKGVLQRKYIHLRVDMDITKPLLRGRMIVNNGVHTWINSHYELIQTICHTCGQLSHRSAMCSLPFPVDNQFSYREWLKADIPSWPFHAAVSDLPLMDLISSSSFRGSSWHRGPGMQKVVHEVHGISNLRGGATEVLTHTPPNPRPLPHTTLHGPTFQLNNLESMKNISFITNHNGQHTVPLKTHL